MDYTIYTLHVFQVFTNQSLVGLNFLQLCSKWVASDQQAILQYNYFACTPLPFNITSDNVQASHLIWVLTAVSASAIENDYNKIYPYHVRLLQQLCPQKI